MKKCLTILCLALSFSTTFAASPSQEAQDKLNAIKSMSARFNQVIMASQKEVSRTEGSMALLRPGRFRWESKGPVEQLVVADGKKLWIYDVDLEQVTVKKQEKTLSGTPALFLSSANDGISKDFTVSKTVKPDGISFDLKAKSSKENYQHVLLAFAGDKLSSIEFYDQLGQHTVIHFSEVQNNQTLVASLFQFNPPKGVDLVSQ